MRRIWLVIAIIIILGISIYALHIYVFIQPSMDSLLYKGTEQEVIDPVGQNSQKGVAVQSLLNVEPNMDSKKLTIGHSPVYERGLFSWENDAYEPHNLSSYYLILNLLEIDEVYQDFDGVDVKNVSAIKFAQELSLLNVDLYLLTGNSEWTYDGTGTPMLKEIERVLAFREVWGEDTIDGIVFDIEPYASERWDNGERDVLMRNYVTGMKLAYSAAKDNGLRVILCVPTWYDRHYTEYFKQLIQYCDELSVMNYVREDEYSNMVDEVEYARAMDKDIACILEFQRAGKHELTDVNTYYNDGISAAIASFENLYRDFSYTRLKLAFHYLKPIREIIQQ